MKLPYGYVLIEGEIAVHEEKADMVRSIFDAYLAGASLRKIVDMLFAKGILMFLTTHSGWFNKVFFKQNWRNYGNSIYIRPQNRNSLAIRLRNGSVRAIIILAITGG